MAETVKKSRIVSDDEDNLEESLLEEFNMRLKKCMSQDNLQNPERHMEEGKNTVYENISNNAQQISNNALASNDFLQSEREHYYDQPTSLQYHNRQEQNARNTDDETENIYETLPEEIKKTENLDQYVNMSSPNITKNNLTVEVSPDIEIENTVYEEFDLPKKDCVYVENSYEVVNVDESDKTPCFTFKTTDFSENKSPENEAKSSVKDRMFLATDDAGTLLFTQTVTSPMLTPSEENIDFLKGFQRENTNSDNTTSSESPQKEEDLDKVATEKNYTSDISGEVSVSEPLATYTEENKINDKDNIYENAEFLKHTSDAVYENLKERANDLVEENIYENLKDLKRKEEYFTDKIGNIYRNLEEKELLYEHEEQLKENTEISNEILTLDYDKSNNRNQIESPKTEITTDLDADSDHVIEEHHENVQTMNEIIKTKTHNTKTKKGSTRNHFETLESNNMESVENNGDLRESYSEFIHHSKSESNYYEKYTEVVSKNSKNVEISNREKDTASVPAEIVKNLKSQFLKTGTDVVASTKKDVSETNDLKAINIMKQIHKFESKDSNEQTIKDSENSTVTEWHTETTTVQSDAPGEKAIKKKKSKKSRKEEKENISVTDLDNVDGEYFYNVNVKNLCRSFGDLTKIDEENHTNRKITQNDKWRTKSLSNVLLSSNKKSKENVFSEVSVRALKEKFSYFGNKGSKCTFKTEALKSSFSKFDALQKKNVLHVRSSDSAKAQEKFNGAQHQIDTTNCKACTKQVFQMEQIKAEKAIWHKNCFRCMECSKQLTVETYISHEGNLYCKPHFKSLFAPKVVDDDAPPSDKPDLGLEELQKLNVKERFQVFEQHQTETHESDRGSTPVNVKRSPSILSKLARFQAKGMDVGVSDDALNGIPIEESTSEEEEEEEDVPEGEDPTLYKAKKVQKEKPFHFTNLNEVKSKWEHQGEQNFKDERREERKQEIQSIRSKLFLGKQGKMKEAYQQAVMQSESSTNLIKSEKIESCDTKSLKERFEKGDLFNEKESKTEQDDEENEVFQSEISKKSRSLFLELDANASKAPQISPVTPQQKLDVRKAGETETPDREIYHDPEVIRADDGFVDDSVIAKTSHTASKMLNKFRQMEENLAKDPEPAGPKPLKRFTPPPEPARPDSSSEDESDSEEEESDEEDQIDNQKIPDDLLEAQKAARAKQLRAKFEKWEAQEIKREQSNNINIVEEYGDDSQVESTKSLRARFESMREASSDKARTPRVKVNRFVEISSNTDKCQSCHTRVYPLEKISVHGNLYHKNCFKCMECSCILRMDSYSYNQGLLYCTPHFKRLFISKGNYDTAFGLDQHKEKWNINATMA